MTHAEASYRAGYEYATQSAPQGYDWCEPVDIDRMLGSTQEMPDADYTTLRSEGVEPDAREYWQGYNDYLRAHVRYAVQYQLAPTHTGRLHRSRAAVERDLLRCHRAARLGGDVQMIWIATVIV